MIKIPLFSQTQYLLGLALDKKANLSYLLIYHLAYCLILHQLLKTKCMYVCTTTTPRYRYMFMYQGYCKETHHPVFFSFCVFFVVFFLCFLFCLALFQFLFLFFLQQFIQWFLFKKRSLFFYFQSKSALVIPLSIRFIRSKPFPNIIRYFITDLKIIFESSN